MLEQAINKNDDDALGTYSDRVLARVWKAQHFSYWMTSLMHITPDATEFDTRRSLGELALLTESRPAQQALAESYVGWDYGVAFDADAS